MGYNGEALQNPPFLNAGEIKNIGKIIQLKGN